MRPALSVAERRRTLLTFAAMIVVPLGLGLALWGQVNRGFQGGAVEERQKEYWQKNHATWLNQPQPYVTHVDMDLDFEPAERAFRVAGAYDLQNRKDKELNWFAISGGTAWKNLTWTLNGKPWSPEDRDGLYVFRLPQPMTPEETQTLVATAIADAGATSKKEMGAVMKLATERAAGRVDGKTLSSAVSAALGN